MSKAVKIKIYKMMVKPVAVYDCKTCAMTERGMKRLGTRERKILRRSYGPVVEQGMWSIRTNQELRGLYKNIDIVADN
jgi:hypothetical protein